MAPNSAMNVAGSSKWAARNAAKLIHPTSKFCLECGHNLTAPHSRPPQDLSFDEKLAKIQKYLPGGLTEKILSQRDRIEGERRHVTIMFVDMKGFTPLTEKLGPEETFALMDQVFEILIHKIHDYEGTVNELRGDGVLALFGAPIALEDAPQRAIRSALAMHREMTKFSEKIKGEGRIPPILLRIGIHSGPVVVGTSETIFGSSSPPLATRSIWRQGWSNWLSRDHLCHRGYVQAGRRVVPI